MGELKFKSMNLKINTDTTLKYIQVFNGILELTQKELIVLAEFINVGDPNNLCTAETKQVVASNLGFEDFNTLNNYIKRLKDKKALNINTEGNKTVYTAPKFLYPNSTTITINHA